jgi:G3E family GTPase
VKVPFVVVTGFLGSGKTTLVNALLARRAARGDAPGKLGVVVNELGAVGIDGALIGGATRQVELPGGCVCCVLGDELDRTLLELVDANPDLEAIVLETTGVAEPLPIAWAVAREPVASRVRLAAVVTLVDASNFLASRAVSAAVDAQVAYADVLLVTKAQLVSLDAATAATSAARTLAPRALVREGTTAEHAAWLDELLADPPASGESQPSGQDPAHVHTDECRHPDTSHAHPDTSHAHGIDSVWIPAGEVVDLEELEDQLAELPANYVRIKGIIRAVDPRVRSATPRWIAVHRVGPRVSSEPVEAPDFEEGRLVALGPSVNRVALARCVAAAKV